MPQGLFKTKSKKNDNKNDAKPKIAEQDGNQSAPDSPGARIQSMLGNQGAALKSQQANEQAEQANPAQENQQLSDSDPFEEVEKYIAPEEINRIYKEKLAEPLKLAVLLKFGVGRGQWRRSSELNAFRKKLKDAARQQANEDISNHVGEHEQLKEKSRIGKSFFGMAANAEAYGTSKTSVNAIMEQEATKIAQRFAPEESSIYQLKMAAFLAMSPYMNKKKSEKAAKKAGLTSAQEKARQLLKSVQDYAVNEARMITKGDRFKEDSKADVEQQNRLKDEVGDRVTKDEIGRKALDKVIESDSINSGLTKVGGIIDNIVSSEGEAASIGCQLKIPFGNSGGYAIITFEGEAERDGELMVGAQIGVGIGFTAGIVDFNHQLGFFIEAQADNSTAVMNLISYGMYRHINSVLPSVAESLWGLGGKSGKTEAEEAEMWASAIEAEHMDNDDSYVDVGSYYKRALALELGVAEAELTFTEKSLTRFSKETIGDDFGDDADVDNLEQKAKRLRGIAANKVLHASGSLSVDLGFNSFDLEAEGALTTKNDQPVQEEVSIGTALPFTIGDQSVKWVDHFSRLISPTLGLLDRINRALTKRDALKNASVDGNNNNTSELSAQIENLSHSVSEMSPINEKDSSEIALSIISPIQFQTTITFNFEKEWTEDGKPGDWEVSLEIGKTKSFEVDAGVFSLEVEKSKKLAVLSSEKKDGKYASQLKLL